jgi:hypothetical protein
VVVVVVVVVVIICQVICGGKKVGERKTNKGLQNFEVCHFFHPIFFFLEFSNFFSSAISTNFSNSLQNFPIF